jgi:hypothetical protein
MRIKLRRVTKKHLSIEIFRVLDLGSQCECFGNVSNDRNGIEKRTLFLRSKKEIKKARFRAFFCFGRSGSHWSFLSGVQIIPFFFELHAAIFTIWLGVLFARKTRF